MQVITCILTNLINRKLVAEQYGLDSCGLDKLIKEASAYHWIMQNAPDCLTDIESKKIDVWIKENYNCYTASVCSDSTVATPCPGFSIELDEESSQFYRVTVTGGNSLFTYLWEWDTDQYSLRTGTANYSTIDLEFTGEGTPTSSTVSVTVVDSTLCRRTDSVNTVCAPRAKDIDSAPAQCNSELTNSWNPFVIDFASHTEVCVEDIDWNTLNITVPPEMTASTIGSVATITITPNSPLMTYNLGWNVRDTAGNLSNTGTFGITLGSCVYLDN